MIINASQCSSTEQRGQDTYRASSSVMVPRWENEIYARHKSKDVFSWKKKRKKLLRNNNVVAA